MRHDRRTWLGRIVCSGAIAAPLLVGWMACGSSDETTAAPTSSGTGGAGGGCSGEICGVDCCASTEACVTGRCYTDLGPCQPGDVCPEDGTCADGHCIPWGELPQGFDPACTREVPPGPLRPGLQCAWEGDSTHAVLHTPLGVDFRLPSDPDLPAPGPSIVVVGDTAYSEGGPGICESSGTVTVLDGRTCTVLYAVTGETNRVLATVAPAAGDLDGDGRPEIVAGAPEGGLRAFRYDEASDAFVKLWDSTDGNGNPSTLGGDTCQWGGITIADLDGGAPEIFFHGAAHDSQGRIIATIPGYQFVAWGNPMVVVDADLDGAPEVVEGFGTYDYDSGSGLSLIPGWVGSGGPGFVAVADFGDFPAAAGDAAGRPEIVVVNAGVRLQTVLGEVVFTAAGGYGTGGPPTVADFDGDGGPEIGVAFGDGYAVYDRACVGAPAPCQDEGILWRSASQDVSSAKTGSSVFDFNGDGRAEAVYGDECFVRVYDGPTGKVMFSQGRMSSTWEENVIIADVDGDSAAELVLSASAQCNPGYCAEWDPSFEGVPCDTAADCPGGGCDSGYCRCASDDECGDSFKCSAPLPSTPGAGNVCRTKHEGCAPGIRVYRDARDRWAGSRSVWNQHAYSVTNVGDDGTVPPVGEVQNNWAVAGLNNFRQNVQGTVGPMPAPDLTVKELVPSCEDGSVSGAEVTVCNRGAAGVDANVSVSIVATSGSDTAQCAATTTGFLTPGFCETVQCALSAPDGASLEATVNPNGDVGECLEGNNSSQPVVASCGGA